jgi:hypothetical protein
VFESQDENRQQKEHPPLENRNKASKNGEGKKKRSQDMVNEASKGFLHAGGSFGAGSCLLAAPPGQGRTFQRTA